MPNSDLLTDTEDAALIYLRIAANVNAWYAGDIGADAFTACNRRLWDRALERGVAEQVRTMLRRSLYGDSLQDAEHEAKQS